MELLSTVRDIISIIGLLAAAYFFLLRREFFPRAQFDLSMRLLGERDDELLLELGATVKNIGLVRHSIESFTFSLRGLSPGNSWEMNPDIINLINFPEVLQSGDWVRKKYITVVEPGTEQRFYFIVNISAAKAEYINLYANIVYTADWIPDHSAAITRSLRELKKQYFGSTEIPKSNAAVDARDM